jgi:hypothetical protein
MVRRGVIRLYDFDPNEPAAAPNDLDTTLLDALNGQTT